MRKKLKDLKPRYVCGISITGDPDLALLNQCREKGFGNTQIFREGMNTLLGLNNESEKSS